MKEYTLNKLKEVKYKLKHTTDNIKDLEKEKEFLEHCLEKLK
jgi:hypothetical protein